MRKQNGRRGSAILIVAYLGLVLASVVGVHFYRSSQTASDESRVRETSSGAQAAAEYAAEVAIANLTDMNFKTEADGTRVSVVADWVNRNLYNTLGPNSAERRISGKVGDYNYKILVRSVRDAKALSGSDAPSDAWLSNIDPEDYTFGVDPLRKFTGAYEVIASARHVSGTRSNSATGQSADNPAFAAMSTIRTVVNLSYNSVANDWDNLAVASFLNTTDTVSSIGSSGLVGPAGLTDSGLTLSVKESGTDAGYISSSSAGGYGLIEGRNGIFTVAAEDHYAYKAPKMDVFDDELIIEGLASIPGIPSQLYSVVNDRWNYGKLSLHFRSTDVPNPTIPRTANFFTDGRESSPKYQNHADHREMITLDTSRKLDEYVFGGKRQNPSSVNTSSDSNYFSKPTGNGSNLIYGFGRSITVDAGGKINELTGASATPSMYAETALAVGTVENVLRFYLNFVEQDHPVPGAAESVVNNWKINYWRQLPIGYHTKNRTKNGNLYSYRRPLDNRDSTARRRWTVLLWIKDKHGRFLARDHNYTAANGTGGSYPIPNNTWNGRYRWAMYGGYASATNTDGGNYHIGKFSSSDTWTNKSYEKGVIYPRMLTLQELIGYKFYTDSDGVPAKLANPASPPSNQILSDSQIVAGVPDYYLEGGQKVPYEENGSQFDEDYQRLNRADNYGRASSFSYPTDGIYVYDDKTGQTTKYTTLKDFSYELDISEPGDPEDIREVLLLHMVFEDNPEVSTGNPNMYFDMGLTVTVVYPKKIEVDPDDDEDMFLQDIFRHWWNGDSQESLTGEMSHYAVSALMDDQLVVGLADDVEKMKAYYKQFGLFDPANENKVTNNIWTMTDGTGDRTGFGKTQFVGRSIDPDYPETLTDTAIDSRKDGRSIFYNRNDLYEVYNFSRAEYYRSLFVSEIQNDGRWDTLKDDLELFLKELNIWREEKALAKMEAANSGTDFYKIQGRFNETNSLRVPLKKDNMKEIFKVPEPTMTTRYLVAQAFGFKNVKTPGAYAMEVSGALQRMRYTDLDPMGSPDWTPITKLTIPLIPGEYLPLDGTESLETIAGTYMPMMTKTLDEVPAAGNGRPLKPKFIWRSGALVGEQDLTNLHDWPNWFIGDHANDDPDYAGYMNPDLRPALLEEWPTEHRGALGWHREGKYAHVPNTVGEDPNDIANYKLTYGDHYEYVIMSEKGFMPYEAVNSDGLDYVASIRPETGGVQYIEDCQYKLVPPERMPTFVIDGPEIDGAGILVVNGNLEIRTRFAYHGLIMVMGNLTVTPEEYMVPDEDGNIVDKNGNVLFQDGGNWYYMKSGVRYDATPVTQWRGEMVVQGKIAIGGTVTCAQPVYSAGVERPGAIIDIRGSQGAVDDVLGPWLKIAPNEGFDADRLGWSSGSTSSNYDLWKE